MTDFVRCNKVSGVYWLSAPVENLTIRVKLKQPDDILLLPKFEDYTNDSINIKSNIEEHSFKWQEKCFSMWEKQYYSSIHNCLSEVEIKYHETTKNNDIVPSKVFTYIHEDYHLPLPMISKKKKEKSKLEQCMEYLNLSDSLGNIGKVFGVKSDSMSHLLKSRGSFSEEENWTAMHVVFDHSNQNEDNIIKQETTLISIYHNTTQNYVLLAPDVNDLETNPYAFDGAVPVDFKYGVSVDFGDMEGSDELETLLSKLYAKWEKKHKILVDFITPPLGVTHYHVSVDLMSAEGFDMDNMYIEYTIKLPEGIQCNNALHGRTHTSESTGVSGDEVWNLGHMIELFLETDTADKLPLKLYLEAISTDWRDNHRTEGYVYHPLPLTPGLRTQELTCLRPEEKSWRGEDRRFFVGGCNLIQDLDVLSKPDGQNTNFTYTTTGKIQVRYSIIAQSGSTDPGFVSRSHPSSSGSSALLLGAEAALDKYKKARAKLAAATRDINIGSGDG